MVDVDVVPTLVVPIDVVPGLVVPRLVVMPSSLAAAAISAQPTDTPRVVVIGRAKHCWPVLQTLVMTKLPWSSHVPTLPAIQATALLVQGEEKLSVEKRLLYPSASAKFALKIAGETVPVVGGADEMIVGIFDIVAAATEVVDGKFVEDVAVLEAVRLDRLMTMTVVEPPLDPV